jgi:hypothetical protein
MPCAGPQRIAGTAKLLPGPFALGRVVELGRLIPVLSFFVFLPRFFPFLSVLIESLSPFRQSAKVGFESARDSLHLFIFPMIV